MITDQEKIDKIISHIKNVQKNMVKLGEYFLQNGDPELGRTLIANSFLHDNSKFYGIEWDALFTRSKKMIALAISQHHDHNPHHPEYWIGGIQEMPKQYRAEMACDICARSAEFGTNPRDWWKDDATKKYGFKEGDDIYHEVLGYMDLLLEKPFVPVT